MHLEPIQIAMALAALMGIGLATFAYCRRSLPLLVLAGVVAVTAAGFALSAIVLA